METMFVTITGTNHYYDLKPFKVGSLVKLVKETDNEWDCEAIKVVMPFIDKVGYVANSANTTFAGTYSAGRIYDKIDGFAFARVMFITHSSVIALVLPPEVNEKLDKNFNEII